MANITSLKSTEKAESVGQQISSGISAIGQGIGGAIGDVGGAIKSFASKLGPEGGIPNKDAVASAGALRGASVTKSKFSDNFVRPQPIRETARPTGKKAPPGVLQYPLDIGEYFITFTFKEKKRISPGAPPQAITNTTIHLPMPPQLVETFGMQYADVKRGVLVGALADTVAKEIGSGASAAQVGKTLGTKTAGLATSPGAAMYAARKATGISDTLGAAVDEATGTVLNPYQALVFQGVSLRQHSFSYKFSPNSSAESEALKKIINKFKEVMHPAQNKLLFDFPYVCDIAFGKKTDSPYFFKQCFLENMTVNYAPSQVPSFFRKNSEPTEIELALQFRETRPLVRNDIQDKASGSGGGSLGGAG